MKPKDQIKNKILKLSEEVLSSKDRADHGYLLGTFHGLILAVHILYPQTKLNTELRILKTKIYKELQE